MASKNAAVQIPLAMPKVCRRGNNITIVFPNSTCELHFRGIDHEQAESVLFVLRAQWDVHLASLRRELVRATEAVQAGGRPRFSRPPAESQKGPAEGARTPRRKMPDTQRVIRFSNHRRRRPVITMRQTTKSLLFRAAVLPVVLLIGGAAVFASTHTPPKPMPAPVMQHCWPNGDGSPCPILPHTQSQEASGVWSTSIRALRG